MAPMIAQEDVELDATGVGGLSGPGLSGVDTAHALTPDFPISFEHAAGLVVVDR